MPHYAFSIPILYRLCSLKDVPGNACGSGTSFLGGLSETEKSCLSQYILECEVFYIVVIPKGYTLRFVSAFPKGLFLCIEPLEREAKSFWTLFPRVGNGKLFYTLYEEERSCQKLGIFRDECVVLEQNWNKVGGGVGKTERRNE